VPALNAVLPGSGREENSPPKPGSIFGHDRSMPFKPGRFSLYEQPGLQTDEKKLCFA